MRRRKLALVDCPGKFVPSCWRLRCSRLCLSRTSARQSLRKFGVRMHPPRLARSCEPTSRPVLPGSFGATATPAAPLPLKILPARFARSPRSSGSYATSW